MSAPCRSRLCEGWYINTTMACLSCVTDHVTGTELENFASIIDVYNSTCNNRSLVVSTLCSSGTRQRPRDVVARPPEQDATYATAVSPPGNS